MLKKQITGFGISSFSRGRTFLIVNVHLCTLIFTLHQALQGRFRSLGKANNEHAITRNHRTRIGP